MSLAVISPRRLRRWWRHHIYRNIYIYIHIITKYLLGGNIVGGQVFTDIDETKFVGATYQSVDIAGGKRMQITIPQPSRKLGRHNDQWQHRSPLQQRWHLINRMSVPHDSYVDFWSLVIIPSRRPWTNVYSGLSYCDSRSRI